LAGGSAVYGDALDALGSVPLPLKVVAMNMLSLTATFGVRLLGERPGELRAHPPASATGSASRDPACRPTTPPTGPVPVAVG
jgi:hypothetical protein